MEKKTGQITVHLTPEDEALFRQLAEEIEGLSGSELGHELFSAYLKRKRSQFESMQRAFSLRENQRGGKN
jgi:hypothetical protein